MHLLAQFEHMTHKVVRLVGEDGSDRSLSQRLQRMSMPLHESDDAIPLVHAGDFAVGILGDLGIDCRLFGLREITGRFDKRAIDIGSAFIDDGIEPPMLLFFRRQQAQPVE